MRRQTEEPADRALDLASALNDLVGATSVHQLTKNVCKACRDLLGASGATFVLSEGESVYYAEELAQGKLWKGQRFPATACISGWAIARGESAAIEDIYEDSRIPREAYRPTSIRSLLMTPLKGEDGVVGAIGVYWNQRHKPQRPQVEAMQQVAEAAVRALRQATLLDECAHLRDNADQFPDPENEMLAQMVPIIAHDLRTPLSVVNTGLHLLQHESLSETGQKAIARMSSSLQRADRMVRQLMDYSEIREHGSLSLDLRKVDLERLCTDAIAELRNQRPKRDIRLEAQSLDGWWDRDRLLQALSNLISNALEHGSPESPITVRATSEGSEAYVSVHNEGPSIPTQVRPHLFDAFSRLGDHERKGSIGLGLFITDQIVRGHGGRMELRSSEEHGTTFTMVLPRHPGKRAQDEQGRN